MKITMYELLGMVKEGKAPKRIRIRSASGVYDKEFYFDGDIYMYKDEDEEYAMTDAISIEMLLNDEVEILEEKEMCHKCHKYPAEYNQTYCEFCLGISKLEEKKIPEKLGLTYLEDDDKNNIIDKINEIIDYLQYFKSKGDE